MDKKNLITLDCNIFGLQKFGGISSYWAKLVDHVSLDQELSGSLILPKRLTYRDFDNSWLQRMSVRQDMLHSQIARYLSAPTDACDGIFHTSYYRLPCRQVGKYVVTVYDFTYERYRTGFARLVHTKQKLASILRADAVICISESTRCDVIEFCPGVDIAKLHVIHLGVDHKAFYREPVKSCAENSKTVLFVGQRKGYKRFDLAIEAVRELPELSLGIVGPMLTDEERIFLQARLGTRWHEFGPVSTADLRRLYSSAFAFIYPSDYEGFGLPILEAMACGCPVVAAAQSSFPEVGGIVAYYAERQSGESYASALCALGSVAERENVVRSGIKRAGEFDWLQTFQRTRAVYLGS